jgi:hypothetical protein
MSHQKAYDKQCYSRKYGQREQCQQNDYCRPDEANACETYISNAEKESAVLPEYRKYVVEIGPYRLLRPHEPILFILDIICLLLAILGSIYLYPIIYHLGIFLWPLSVFVCAWLGLELFRGPGLGFIVFTVFLCNFGIIWCLYNLGFVIL